MAGKMSVAGLPAAGLSMGLDMKHQMFWLCLLSLSLPLLFWFGHVITRDGLSHVLQSNGLRGYMRITPGRMDQLLYMHCSQCALVSSSGQMFGAGVGEEIDKVGCVIRMNNAPTQGNMRQDGKGHVFNTLLKIAEKYPKVRIYAVTTEKIRYCDGVFQNETGKNRMKTGAFLSTGFFAMILAIDICDSIHVYGMIDDNYCSRANHSVVPYHYYERNRIDECKMYRFHEHTQRGGHRFITEKAIYAKWATRHKMEFKHPSWSL
ncbi:alpha-N-acetyl-neuraminyl-2,3-beta-galactosyl-1,3-N-acetyl-galactosaminide alpha-2,6-sialyltransferase isoform 2-T2 [Lycodopsis pacificus]